MLLVSTIGMVLALVWRSVVEPLPGPLQDVAARVELVPGVVGLDTEDTTSAGLSQDPVTFVDWTVRLDPALSPAAAQSAASAVTSEARVPASLESSTVLALTFTTGPTTSAGDETMRLRSPDEGAVALAYSLLASGASTVDDSTVTVPDAARLAPAAAVVEHADEGGMFRPPNRLRTGDDAVVYDAGLVPRAATAGLVADVAAYPGVTRVAFTWEQVSPSELRITTTSPTGSDDARALATLLDDAPESTVVTPTGYTLVADDGSQTTGWVAGLEPPRTVPHSVPLPDDVEQWPADADAPDCTGSDLELTLGTPDAALGSRYLGVEARNISAAPCAVDGVPDVVFRDADGEEQAGVRFVAAAPGVVPGRVVVPPGENLLATLEWDAMSTANDPDVTTALDVTPVPGADPVRLVPEIPAGAGTSAGPTTLDVLDGAEVQIGPWAQGADGWS